MEESQPELSPNPASPSANRPGFLKFAKEILETILISAILFLSINAVSTRIRVDGSSMEPGLHTGEFILVDKISYRFGKPQRGDIIVFYSPRDPSQEYIKRVIGLPGDKVEMNEGQLFVNDQLIYEPYIKASPAYPGSWSVPEDSLFVLGDNRNNSSDSHTWGVVPLTNVIGRALIIYWPPQQWGLVDHITILPN